MKIYLFLSIAVTLSSCSFLARNNYKNKLLYSYASEHRYDLPFETVEEKVKWFAERQRDDEQRRSDPKILIATDGFFYKNKVYHSWRKVELEALGFHVKKNMAPVPPYTVILKQKDRTHIVGINHLFKVFLNAEKLVVVEAHRLGKTFIDKKEFTRIREMLKGSVYEGKLSRMVDLNQAIKKAKRDYRVEWEVLAKIDNKARNSYVEKATQVVEGLEK